MKEPIVVLVLENTLVKLYDETDYRLNSPDNLITYENLYLNGDHPTSMIGVHTIEDEKLVSKCLIASEGGATSLQDETTLVSYGGLLVCCSNTIFKLTLPNLNLEWKTQADTAACFGVYYLDEDYLVHGELEITRLDKNGKIVWKQTGRDIWTTLEGNDDDFEISDNYILATDWQYNRYKFDFDGKLLEEYKKIDGKTKNEVINQEYKTKTKWWQFFTKKT